MAQYAASVGYQSDIRAARNVGTRSRRVVGGFVDTQNVTVNPGSNTGTVTFSNVNLAHNTAGYEVRVDVKNVVDDAASEAKTVVVDTGAHRRVGSFNDSCVLADGDTETPGVQVAFTVSRPRSILRVAVPRPSSRPR